MNGGREDPSLLDADGEREEEEVSNKAARLAARTRTQMGKREVGGRTSEVASGKNQFRYEMDMNVRVKGTFREYQDGHSILLQHLARWRAFREGGRR